jgi:hypothetical protein
MNLIDCNIRLSGDERAEIYAQKFELSSTAFAAGVDPEAASLPCCRRAVLWRRLYCRGEHPVSRLNAVLKELTDS